jgi:hypothetical protein
MRLPSRQLLAWLDKIFSIVELIIPTTLDFYAGNSRRGTAMLEQVARVMNPLPLARTRKKAWLAFVLGFLLSGLALGIYFRNWVDLVVPTVIWLALIATPGDTGFWAGAVIGGLWGLLRAINTNERLSASRTL